MGQEIKKQIKGIIVFKHETEAVWHTGNNGGPVEYTPANGEQVIYDPDNNHTSPRIKIGNGTDIVANLPFVTIELNPDCDDYLTQWDAETRSLVKAPIKSTSNGTKLQAEVDVDILGNISANGITSSNGLTISSGDTTLNALTATSAHISGNASINGNITINGEATVGGKKVATQNCTNDNVVTKWDADASTLVESKLKVQDNGSIIINEGVANGSNSIVGGTKDKTVITNILGSTVSNAITLDYPASNADSTISLGSGTNVQSTGSNAIGVMNTAGIKGFYWSSVNATDKTITLSTSQTKAEWNLPSGITLDWKKDDVISIVNDTKHAACAKIVSVNGNVIKVDNLPFESRNNVTFKAPDDYTIFACYKKEEVSGIASLTGASNIHWWPRVGIVELAWAATAIGIQNIVTGTAGAAFGWNNWVAGDFGFAAGRGNVAGYTSAAFGINNEIKADYALTTGGDNIIDVNGDKSIVAGDNNYVNGAGNLVVGEDNSPIDDNSGESREAGVYGKKNIVAGSWNKVTKDENLIGGHKNIVTADRNIIGGTDNTIDAPRNLTVGKGNRINSGDGRNIIGGLENIISNSDQIIGGVYNVVHGWQNVAGGNGNIINNSRNLVVGLTNELNGSEGHNLVGGKGNIIGSNNSAIVGGANTVNGDHNIAGGSGHTINGSKTVVSGGNNVVSADLTAVFGDGHNISGVASLVGGRSNIVTTRANLVGGRANKVGNNSSVNGDNLVGGYDNTVNGIHNTVAGQTNTVSGEDNVVVGRHNYVGNQVTGIDDAAVATPAIGVLVVGERNHTRGNTSGVAGHIIGGHDNKVTDIENIINGEGNIVTGARNIVSGKTNNVTSKHNIVSGDTQQVYGDSNIVSGTSTRITSGAYNVVNGSGAEISGSYNFVNGANQKAISGSKNTVVGSDNTVTGDENIVAGGSNTMGQARGIVAGQGNTGVRHGLVVGLGNKGTVANSIICGVHANQSDNALLTVGNGTDGAKSNAFEVCGDNTVFIGGQKVATEDYVSARISGVPHNYVFASQSVLIDELQVNTGDENNWIVTHAEWTSKLITGDNIYIIETDTPDYWVDKQGDVIYLRPLEIKIDLTSYVSKTELNNSGYIKTSDVETILGTCGYSKAGIRLPANTGVIAKNLIVGSGNTVSNDLHIVGGDGHNVNQVGNIVAGRSNTVYGRGNAVFGIQNKTYVPCDVSTPQPTDSGSNGIGGNIAGGYQNTIKGINSLIIGQGNVITSHDTTINGAIIGGQFCTNDRGGNVALLLGHGTDANNRKDIFYVDIEGATYTAKSISIGGKVITAEIADKLIKLANNIDSIN